MNNQKDFYPQNPQQFPNEPNRVSGKILGKCC